MSGFIPFFAVHQRLAWLGVALLSITAAALMGVNDHHAKQQLQLSLLDKEVQYSSSLIEAKTLDVNLMGALEVLGFLDPQIKQEASSGQVSKEHNVLATLTTVANFYRVQGALVVSKDGIVMSNWDRINTPATGFNVSFRPYYQIAMQGKTNVYAAVSMTNGDRSLYLTAPILAEQRKASSPVGALVALIDLAPIDEVLKKRFDIALLLSPQGLVFASSHPEWNGMLAEPLDAPRLAAIRELKQFGLMFANKDPNLLPITSQIGLQTVEGRLFAVSEAPVKWNDPYGDWRLIVYEDLSRSVSWQTPLLKASAVGLLGLLLGWMWLHLLKGRYRQTQTNLQLRAYAEQQAARVAYRANVGLTAQQLQRCQSMAEMAQVFLHDARELLGAVQGALYVVDERDPQRLRLAGAAACAETPSSTLAFGEGLLGECAVTRRQLVIATPPAGIWTLRSGLGDSQPAALLLTPLIAQDTLVGVLELAVLQLPDKDLNSKLEELAALLANNLEILRSNLQLQHLAQRPADNTGLSA